MINLNTGKRLIAIVNGISGILHLIFWLTVLFNLELLEKPQEIKATTLGFGIADLLWSVPLLLTGSYGLWHSSSVGWLAAVVVCPIYWYSMTTVMIRDLIMQTIAPGTVLFMPFALFSIWAFWFLWKQRASFH